MRKLIILGTGSAMVTKCFNTCFAIQLNDEYFLVDGGGGNGILKQLEAANISCQKIHHMFVTHGHTDHVLGVIWVIRKIATLMNQNKYDGNFTIYCHDELIAMLMTMTRLTLKKKDFEQIGKRIILHEILDKDTLSVLNMQLTCFDIASTKAKQFGFTAQFADGLKLSCLGDEPYNERCHDLAADCDWLLSEAFCRYADRDIFKPYEKHHSTVKEACETAQALNAKNLILYHTEDKNMAQRQASYIAEGKAYYTGNLLVPNDLTVIEF